MPVAPTPPTKPTPPVPPTLTPAGSNIPADAHTAQTPNPDKPASSQTTGAVREQTGKAFPGNINQTKPDKAGSAEKPANQSQTIQAAPAQSWGSQTGISTETAVPAKPPLVADKSSGSNYIFFMEIVGLIAVILVGLRLFKEKRKIQQPRTLIDYSQRTTTVMDQDGVDVFVAPQTAAPKVERNFEVRI